MAGEVNFEFQKAIEKKRLMIFDKGKKLVKKEISSAEDDIKEARDRLKNNKYKYATINGYYSMFHSVRTLVYSKSYREKSHYYLLVALQSLFVEKGLIEEDIAKQFHTAMILREEADYHGEFSKEGAECAISSAEALLKKSKVILKL